ncbi:hypothetical protein [Spiroplasma ixodetis]|uniref:Uncharacterized protein n=1 Tax=Spiroplasma ixodetis TaxID=2141 RepID=A0ABM8JT34_9MOLU
MMKDKSFKEIKNDMQLFFQDIENGKYGERIKELFIQKESS